MYEKNLTGADRLRKFARSANFRKSVIVIVILIISLGIWNQGSKKIWGEKQKSAILAAQAKSPMPPEWVKRYFGKDYCTRVDYCGPDADPDSDQLSNYEEYLYYTDPTDPDTDGDGALDGIEVRNLSNPTGSGDVPSPRDIASLYENNPIADELIKAGLEEIKKGNITTIDQIVSAASRIKAEDLPQFYEIPFKIRDNNNQQAIYNYLAVFTKAAEDFQASPSAELGASIVDVQELDKLNEYLTANNAYANAFTLFEVPSDLLKFHKAYYGSLIYKSLIVKTQRDFVAGDTTDAEAEGSIRTFTIYYVRLLQDATKAAKDLGSKYDFPFSLSNSDTNSNL